MGQVLILTNTQDIHADLVLRELKRRSVDVIRLHTDEYPTKVKITYRNDDIEVNIPDADKLFRASEIRSVWYRRPKKPSIHQEITDSAGRSFAMSESEQMVENLYALLEDSFWVNPLLAGRRARNKLLQLRVAMRCGLTTPETIVTNDPDVARRFIECATNGVIYKPILSGRIDSRENERGARLIFTTLLSENVLQLIDRVSFAPCCFQNYIEKQIEVRTTIVGDQIFSCAIHSQEDERAMIDWRAHAQEIRYEPYRLPVTVEDMLKKVMRELGLHYGAFDLILTPKNQWVMLEVNPNGQWAFVEGFTRQPIAGAVASLLAEGNES